VVALCHATRAAEGNVVFVDDNGYTPLPDHLKFLRLTLSDLSDCHSHDRPLGMTPPQFRIFFDSLKQALRRDKLASCDVRLKGSSATFYSGPHKLMPTDRITLRDLFYDARGVWPEEWKLDDLENCLTSVWPSGTGPHRRPFDSMYRIGITGDPSDYDIQVSSDEILRRAADHLGVTIDDPALTSEKYDFIHKHIIAKVCPYLTRWAAAQSTSTHLGRLVAVATFRGTGPPNKESPTNKLSSHFHKTDWVLIPEKVSVSK
jgi:hypothetical protein